MLVKAPEKATTHRNSHSCALNGIFCCLVEFALEQEKSTENNIIECLK